MAHDIFISHSDHDARIALELALELEKSGFSTWSYEIDRVAGTSYLLKTQQAISAARVVVLIISRNSIASSQVTKEVVRGHENGKPFIPLLVELTYPEFIELQPEWQEALGSATAIELNPAKPVTVLDDMTKGLEDLRVPRRQGHDDERVAKIQSEFGKITVRSTETAPPLPRPPQPQTQGAPSTALARQRRRSYQAVLTATATTLCLFLSGRVALWYTESHREKAELKTNLSSFATAAQWLNWLVYDPIGYDPYNGTFPSEASIRQDLELLRRSGFDGLVTVTSRGSLRHIPRIAREVGFNQIVVGVYDLRDSEDVANALGSAKYADAFCLGHDGLDRHYSLAELRHKLRVFHAKTRRPVSTTEIIGEYEVRPDLVSYGDFLFPDAHASWQRGSTPQNAWDETVDFARRMAKLAAGRKLVLLKMVSFPSGGLATFSDSTQTEFYRLAVERAHEGSGIPGKMPFVFMEAFDPTFKTGFNWQPSERYVGLFTEERRPKLAVTSVNWEAAHK